MSEVGIIAMNFHWGRNEIFGLKSRERKIWAEAIRASLDDIGKKK